MDPNVREAAQDKTEDAYRRWDDICQHYTAIYKYVAFFIFDSDAAKDITQNVFLAAFQHLHAFQGQSSVKTWLTTIATNACLKFLKQRAQRNYRELSIESIPASRMIAPASPNVDPGLLAAIGSLSERQRTVITMRIISQLSYKEIGQELGLDCTTARSHFYAGVVALRNLLKRDIK